MTVSIVLNIVLGLVVLILILVKTPREKWTDIQFASRHLNPLPPTFKNEWKEMLTKHFPFYKQLPTVSKVIFEKRIAHFVRSKEFIPRNLTEITDEMKVFISASAIQLTFGLPRIYLAHFRYILVYPDDYYSTITRHYHKGEVNPRAKAIVISWKAYLQGYLENEGVNLGLHEMAHALHLENRIRNEEFDFFPEEELAIWDDLADREMKKITNGSDSFFRSSGATNTYEFFAVAVENFFERPDEFNRYNAPLFQSLSNLLNQNPLLLRA